MAPGGGRGRGGNGRAIGPSNPVTNLGPVSADAHVDAQTDETTRAPKRVRGHSKGLAADKIFRATGSKLNVNFASGDNRPSGENRGAFTTEIGIVVRNHAPRQVETWRKIHESEKKILIERVLTKFNADISNPIVKRFILKKMSDRYNDSRNEFHLHFKNFTTVEEARRNKHERTTQEDWDYICTLFSSEKFQLRSKKCSENRAKLPFNHCGGSKPFVEYRYEDEKGVPLEEPKGDIQLFHDTHFDGERGWVDLVSKLRYQAMFELQNSAETEMTEAEICRKVLGNRSGYVKGRGFGPRPESTAYMHSRGSREETEALRSEVLHLTEFIAGYNETNAQLLANQARTEAIVKKLQESLAPPTSPCTDSNLS